MSSERRSGLFRGHVMHQRLRPLRHRLDYRVFSLLLDLDELPALDARLRCFSVGRFNVFSFRPSDHGDGMASDAAGLRAYAEARLREAGMPTGGAIRLLALPRILGYAFNPLSVWFCDAPDGTLQAIVYEVNNTFGDRHSYLVEVDAAQRAGGRIEQRSGKALFVSPFLGMTCTTDSASTRRASGCPSASACIATATAPPCSTPAWTPGAKRCPTRPCCGPGSPIRCSRSR